MFFLMLWMFKPWDNSISSEDWNFDDFMLEVYSGAQIPVVTVGFELKACYV